MDKKEYLGDGVITGSGKIHGRNVFVYAQDFTVFGGSLSETCSEKICKIMDLAMKLGVPIIGLNDSGGARIQEGIESLKGYADIFYRNVKASGLIPQIAAILGPCAGGAVYSPALMDFVFMSMNNSYMFLTGPKVVKSVTNEDVTDQELGGPIVHATKSGTVHFLGEDDKAVLLLIRELLTYIPQNNAELSYIKQTNDPYDRLIPELDDIIPANSNLPYDMKNILHLILDDGVFFEVHGVFAQNIITGFGRLSGKTVGIVANQPKYLAGVIDIDASKKASRFIRFCDAFNIPILTLVDVPGFLPGTSQEYGGIIANGAKLLYAYSEATVPKITIIIRKSYGGAYCALGSKHLGTDINFAWPSAEIAVMEAKGAVEILYRKECLNSPNPKEAESNFINDYRDKFSNPYAAAKRGHIDEVIIPRFSRIKLIKALDLISTKREVKTPKKHGNIPL